MRQPRGTVWTERALVMLILASLGGTLNLVMAVHRRATTPHTATEPVSTPIAQRDAAATNVPVNDPRPVTVSALSSVPAPKPANLLKASVAPPEDPTKKALAELAAIMAQETEAARQADRRTASLEKARLDAVAESERWRRREMLVKQQVSALADRARKIDRQIDTLAAERDVLARERDALKAAVAKSQQGNGSYAVLPYKGSNGSWRRPIVLECTNGTVTLRPQGPTFSMLDLSSMINPRSSPVILAMARELLRVQMSESPDGSPVVPYFVFLIRPDGIRPYYEMRARLEPLGIAFGYELIEQDLKVDVPDFENVATWDGTIPLEEPLMPAPGGGNNGGGDGLAWPSAGAATRDDQGGTPTELAGRIGNNLGAGDSGKEAGSPDDFVWPSQPGARGSKGPGRSQDSGTGPGGSSGQARGPRPQSFSGGTGRRDSSGGEVRSGILGSRAGRGGATRPGPAPTIAGETSGDLAAGVAGAGEGQGRSGGGAGSDPALERWPFPNQESGQGGSDEAGAVGARDGKPEMGPRPRTSGSGTGPRGDRQDQGVALLPDLEPAGNDPGNSAPGSPAGGLLGAVAGSPGQNGSPTLPDPGRSGSGSRSTKPATAGMGTDVAGSSDTNLQVPASPGDAKAPGSAASSASAKSASGAGVGSSPGSMMGSASSTTSSTSGLVFGSEAGSTSGQGKNSPAAPRFKSRIPDGPSKTVEVPFEIVVVCGWDGLVIHPGGYRLTNQSLDARKKDSIVVRELLAVAQQRAAADPTIRPQPRVKFLVESGGSEIFWAARKQILFSGLGWPMSLQVTGAQDPHVLGKETW